MVSMPFGVGKEKISKIQFIEQTDNGKTRVHTGQQGLARGKSQGGRHKGSSKRNIL
jgi:hypothetical protein